MSQFDTRFMTLVLRPVLALVMGCFTVAIAHAVPLADNDSVDLHGTSIAAQPELSGALLATTTVPWDDLQGNTGTLESQVVRETSGSLDFYYRLSNAAGSLAPVFLLQLLDFGSFSADVDFRSDLPGTRGPNHADSFAGPGVPRDLDFSFDDGNRIAPGESSRFMFVRTNARAYTFDQETFAAVIDLISPDFPFPSASFAPVFMPTALPEPATDTLIASLIALLAWGGMGGRRRSRRARDGEGECRAPSMRAR